MKLSRLLCLHKQLWFTHPLNKTVRGGHCCAHLTGLTAHHITGSRPELYKHIMACSAAQRVSNTSPLNSSLPRVIHIYTDCLSLPHLSRLQHQKGTQLCLQSSVDSPPYNFNIVAIILHNSLFRAIALRGWG